MNYQSFEFFFANILITGAAAAFAKTLVAPIERTKLILQNQDSSLQMLKQERPRYKNAFDVLRRVPYEQGVLSYWRGNLVNITRYIPLQALNFSFNDLYLSLLSKFFNTDTPGEKIKIKFIAGGLAGASSFIIVYPLDCCQTKLSTDVGSDRLNAKVKREYAGLRHCIRSVVQEEGLKGFYGGARVGLCGIIVYRSLYFGIFDTIKRFVCGEEAFNEDGKPMKMSLYLSFISAQITTVVSGTVSYPWDTVLRRMMVDSGRPKHMKQFVSSKHAIETIYKQGGIRAFYKGVFSNIFRSTSGALVLVLYDEILYYTNWKQKLEQLHEKK